MIIKGTLVRRSIGRSKGALGCILEAFVLLPCFAVAFSQSNTVNFALPTFNTSTINCTGNSSLAFLDRDGNGAISLSPPYENSKFDPGLCIYKDSFDASSIFLDGDVYVDTMSSFNTPQHPDLETQSLTFFVAYNCGNEASANGSRCLGSSYSVNSNISVNFILFPDGSIYADPSISQDGTTFRTAEGQDHLLAPAQAFPDLMYVWIRIVGIQSTSSNNRTKSWEFTIRQSEKPNRCSSQSAVFSFLTDLSEVFNSSFVVGFSTGVNYYFPVELHDRQPINIWSWSSSIGRRREPAPTIFGSDQGSDEGCDDYVAGGAALSAFDLINIIVPAVFLPLAFFVGFSLLYELYCQRTPVLEKAALVQANKMLEEERASLLFKLKLLDFGAREFTHKELHEATNGFESEIGRGGFGVVYKGNLQGFGTVAVKSIMRTKENADDAKQLVAEVQVIGRVRHVNIVPLYGWCYEKEAMLLMYKFIDNADLNSHLFPEPTSDVIPLAWTKRMKALRGVAAALVFLHEEFESEERVIHRDIKPRNVMLDSGFNARLGDFGLARLSKRSDEGYQTRSLGVGTWGYIAPEYDLGPSPETDVYAFGVTVLVVATGRTALDKSLPESEGLVGWVRNLYDEERLLEAGDANLRNGRNWSAQFSEEMEKLLKVGLYCCLYETSKRPSMREVLTTLQGSSMMLQAEMDAHFPAPVQYPFEIENFQSKSTESSSLLDGRRRNRSPISYNESYDISRDVTEGL